jgi:hypothetical protein
MTIEQTVEIPVSRRLHLDFDLPLLFPSGKAKVTVTPDEGRPADERQGAADFAGLTKRPGDEELLAGAEKIWAWNRAHPEEVKEALHNLRGSLSPASFGGLDGVSYQRKVRDEWDDD